MSEADDQKSKPRKRYTTKQMGDACEMIVAAELTLAGVPALKAPDMWPGYDVIAQPFDASAQRVSVKSRTYKIGGSDFVEYRAEDQFDWLAIVLLFSDNSNKRKTYLIPRSIADQLAKKDRPSSKTANLRYFRIDKVEKLFSAYRNNFTLDLDGRAAA